MYAFPFRREHCSNLFGGNMCTLLQYDKGKAELNIDVKADQSHWTV